MNDNVKDTISSDEKEILLYATRVWDVWGGNIYDIARDEMEDSKIPWKESFTKYIDNLIIKH